MKDDSLKRADFDRIKKRVKEIVADQEKVKKMFGELADMYWISETDSGPGNSSGRVRYSSDSIGLDDIRLTATTSSRDRVKGLHTMLKTSEPKFEVICDNQTYADHIEAALSKWWKESNRGKRAKIESELALSGILFSDENMSVVFVDDELEVATNTIQKNRLEKKRKKTPVLFKADSALVTYPVWDEEWLSEYLTIREVKGSYLKDKFGDDPIVAGMKDDTNYHLKDYIDLEYTCTWVEEKADSYLRGGKHEMSELNRFSVIADGTDLFHEEERKRNPFLYGMWKSGLHRREDETLTSLFTSTFARGSGPLIVVDSSDSQYESTKINVSYQGLTRVMEIPGKAQLVDDKAFDGGLLSLVGMLKNWGESTTIPAQTLGENIAPGMTYSGYAMASQNGRIPLIPIQEATEKLIQDAVTYALFEFRDRGVEWEGLQPNEILDDVEIKVTLEVDLPMDELRTAQTLAQLRNAGVPLSNEFMHTMLQISDSSKMVFDVMSEQATQAAFKLDIQNLVAQMMAIFQGPAPQGGEGGAGGEMTRPPQTPPQNLSYPRGGGPEMAQAGGEIAPATEPIDMTKGGM